MIFCTVNDGVKPLARVNQFGSRISHIFRLWLTIKRHKKHKKTQDLLCRPKLASWMFKPRKVGSNAVNIVEKIIWESFPNNRQHRWGTFIFMSWTLWMGDWLTLSWAGGISDYWFTLISFIHSFIVSSIIVKYFYACAEEISICSSVKMVQYNVLEVRKQEVIYSQRASC